MKIKLTRCYTDHQIAAIVGEDGQDRPRSENPGFDEQADIVRRVERIDNGQTLMRRLIQKILHLAFYGWRRRPKRDKDSCELGKSEAGYK